MDDCFLNNFWSFPTDQRVSFLNFVCKYWLEDTVSDSKDEVVASENDGGAVGGDLQEISISICRAIKPAKKLETKSFQFLSSTYLMTTHLCVNKTFATWDGEDWIAKHKLVHGEDTFGELSSHSYSGVLYPLAI